MPEQAILLSTVASSFVVVVQALSVIFMINRLRRQGVLRKQGRPEQEQGKKKPTEEAAASRASTIPSFDKKYKGKLWNKISEGQKRILMLEGDNDDDGLYGDGDEEGRIVGMEEGFIPPGATSSQDAAFPDHEYKAGEEKRNLLSVQPSKDRLIMPIYQRLMRLQCMHCFLWCLLVIILLVQNHTIVGFEEVEDPDGDGEAPSYAYLLATSLLMGVSALLDGVVVFLCLDDVGRQSITNSERFAYAWACLNFGICFGVSSYGKRSTSREVGDEFYYNGRLPLWDPLFLRCALMFLFSFGCALYSIMFMYCKWNRHKKTTALVPVGSAGQGDAPELDADYETLREQYEEDQKLSDNIEMLTEMIQMLEDQESSPERDETLQKLVVQLTQMKGEVGAKEVVEAAPAKEQPEEEEQQEPSVDTDSEEKETGGSKKVHFSGSTTVVTLPAPTKLPPTKMTDGAYGALDDLEGDGDFPIEFDNQPTPKDRTAWQRLAWFNLSFAIVLVLMYAFVFLSDYYGRDTGYPAAVVSLAWVLFFAGYTPVLYFALMADSEFWQESWMGALDSLVNPLNDPGEEQASVVIDISSIETERVLGRGGFSTVYRGRVYGDSKVAVKILQYEQMTKELVERFLQEVRIFVRFRHVNLVRFIGASISPPRFAIVMELCKPYSLSDMLRRHWTDVAKRNQALKKEEDAAKEAEAVEAASGRRRKKRKEEEENDKKKRKKFPRLFSTPRALDIAFGIADGMRYMHNSKVIHRDLKSSNILFDKADRPKICDFGLSREEVKLDNSFAGTIAYMAPEMIRSEDVSSSSDVYSFAIIFWELLTSQLAWTSNPAPNGDTRPRTIPPLTIMERVAYRKARPPIRPEDNMHPVLKVLLRECWADDPKCRPAFSEIVRRLHGFRTSQHFRLLVEKGDKEE